METFEVGAVDDDVGLNDEPPGPHPLGPLGASLDNAVDQVWEHLRGQPTLDRIFYTAGELGDFSLI